MSIISVARFVSHSLYPKTHKILTLKLTTSSSEEVFYAHLQRNQRNVEKTLASVNVKLSSTCVIKVLQKCYPNQSHTGLRFFIWADFQSQYRHSSYTYSRACELLQIKLNPRTVKDVIEAYKTEACVVSVKTFKVVLNLCRQSRIANEALWVLRKMDEFNLRADTTAYNTVIRLFAESNDMDMADKLMREMGLIDLYPDMITYMVMIKGFCNVNKLDDACGLFKGMRAHGCVPNSVVYSVLLEGVCKIGRFDRAMELLGEMEKVGRECSPTVITYTSVIQVFSKVGRTMEAIGILDRMEAQGCAPNRVTASTLIDGLCGEGRVKEAYKVIDKVVAAGDVSLGHCYSSLVVSLTKIKRFEEAETVFREMLSSELRPDSFACSVVIKELCFQGRMLDGFYLYEEIEKMEYSYSIDSDIYSVLLVGLYEQNHTSQAAKLARLMVEKGIQPQATSVQKLADHLNKFEAYEVRS